MKPLILAALILSPVIAHADDNDFVTSTTATTSEENEAKVEEILEKRLQEEVVPTATPGQAADRKARAQSFSCRVTDNRKNLEQIFRRKILEAIRRQFDGQFEFEDKHVSFSASWADEAGNYGNKFSRVAISVKLVTKKGTRMDASLQTQFSDFYYTALDTDREGNLTGTATCSVNDPYIKGELKNSLSGVRIGEIKIEPAHNQKFVSFRANKQR